MTLLTVVEQLQVRYELDIAEHLRSILHNKLVKTYKIYPGEPWQAPSVSLKDEYRLHSVPTRHLECRYWVPKAHVGVNGVYVHEESIELILKHAELNDRCARLDSLL